MGVFGCDLWLLIHRQMTTVRIYNAAAVIDVFTEGFHVA